MTQEATSDAVWYVVNRCIRQGLPFDAQQVYSDLRAELVEDLIVDPALVVRSLIEWEESGKFADDNYACLHISNSSGIGDGDSTPRYHFRRYFPITGRNLPLNFELTASHRNAKEHLASNPSTVLYHEGLLGVATLQHPLGQEIRTFTDSRGEGSFDLVLVASRRDTICREIICQGMHNWADLWFPNNPLTSQDINRLVKLPSPVPLALNISKNLAGRMHERFPRHGRAHLHCGEKEWERLSHIVKVCIQQESSSQ